jgi:hypothetical protein
MKIDLPLDRTDQDALRLVSRAVFGSRFALEVLLLIAQRDRFYQAEIVALVPMVQGSYINTLLRRLEESGLVEREVPVPGQARVYFRTLASPIWAHCADMASEILRPPGEGSVTQLRPG